MSELFLLRNSRQVQFRTLVRSLVRRRNLRYFVARHLLGKGETVLQQSLSISIGITLGILPIWGFQMITGLAVASLFRLNKLLTMLATHISFPPMLPLVLFLSFQAGTWFMHGKGSSISLEKGINLQTVQVNLLQYVYGSIALAIVAGLVSFILCYCLISAFRLQQQRRKTPRLA